MCWFQYLLSFHLYPQSIVEGNFCAPYSSEWKKKAPYIYIYKRKFSLSALSNWFGFINTIVKVYLYILCEYVQLTTHGCYLSILYIVVKLMTTFASLYTNRFRFQNNILLFQKQPSLYIFVPKESRRGCSIKCILSSYLGFDKIKRISKYVRCLVFTNGNWLMFQRVATFYFYYIKVENMLFNSHWKLHTLSTLESALFIL